MPSYASWHGYSRIQLEYLPELIFWMYDHTGSVRKHNTNLVTQREQMTVTRDLSGALWVLKSDHTARADDAHCEISVGHCGYWSQITQREQTTPTARSQWGIVDTEVRSHSKSRRRPQRDLSGALWVHKSDHTARADDAHCEISVGHCGYTSRITQQEQTTPTARSQWGIVGTRVNHTARADDAHCEISVGHCGYFCRAASTWLGCTSSDMRRYSFCTRVPPELSSGRTSSSDIRCSNAWNKMVEYGYLVYLLILPIQTQCWVECCTLFN